MSYITIRKHLFVNTVSADTVHILCRIFLHFPQRLLDTVNDHSTFYLIIPVAGDHNVGSVFQRKSVWKRLQCFSSHNNHFSCSFLTEHLHICRNTYQKFIISSDSPVFICCNNNIHSFFLSLCNYTAMGIFLICGHVS